MQQEDKKALELKNNKLRTKIKKDINFQQIQDLKVSYSILSKKNNSGLGSNDRIFFLIHKNVIGYINEFQKNLLLPLGTKNNIPKLKASVLIDSIEKVSSEKQVLSINFTQGKQKLVWSFKCPSVDSAKSWSKKINFSMQQKKQEDENPPQNIMVQKKNEQNPINPQIDEKNGSQMKINNQKQVIKEKQQNNKQIVDVEIKQEPIQKNIMQQNLIEEKPSEQQISPSLAQFIGFSQQKKQISKPESSFFVGSTNVKTERDQIDLRSKIDTFSNKGLKLKDEYEKKKNEEKQMKEQIIHEGGGILADIFMVSTNTKLQIEKMRKQWGYEFAKSQNQYEIVEEFKKYTVAVSKKIIDELGLQEKKRYYQPFDSTSNTLKYDINGVEFCVFLTELKEVSSFHEKGTMIANQEAKMTAQEFKNYNYILRLTHNKGKIRVPLCMMLEYKGFTVCSKVMVPAAQSYENMELLEKELEILEAESRINNSLFQDAECGKIVALQSKVYEKLARAENLNKKFDLCYIDGLKYYLPHDFNNFSKDRPYNRLRWELIQDDECEDKVLYGEDMVSLSSRLKLPQHYRDGINDLTDLSKTINERINMMALELESNDVFFTNSHELSSIMHQYGINMRYLGTLLQKIKATWLKEIIISEICARSAKNFLNFDLQDCLLNLSETNDESIRKFQIRQVINFLNKMLGNSQDSDTFWRQLNRQSQSYFKVSIDKEQLNQGYLIQALQNHCNFKLNSLDQQIVLFDSPTPFATAHFSSFQCKNKVFDLNFTELYSSIRSIISQQSTESYEQLRIILNLNRTQHIPDHFKMSDMYDEIIKFLVNWLSPHQAMNVYYPQEIQLEQILPSKALYQIKLAEIRWGLKEGKLQESQKVKEWMVDHINKWIGEAHPILTQLYEIYANYHLMHKDQEKKSVNYCKTAIRNQEKLLGSSHEKLADNYYLLGTVYLNYGKKNEAINTLKKAKEIISKSKNQNSEAYGEVCLKMGQLFLSVNQPKQAIQSGVQAMQIFTETLNSFELIEAIQLVCRSFQIEEDWEKYYTLIENNLIHKVADFSEEVELLERILKVIILPSLKIIAENTTLAQKILKIMNELPETTRAPNMAYNFLRLRIQEKVFPHRFLEILNNIQEVLEEIQSNGMVARWKGFENLSNKSLLNKVGVNMENKGFNFIASLEALNIFIGNSYVEGVLTDQ